MRRVSVIIFGLFPTIYSTCAPCCPSDLYHSCDVDLDQLNEYPEHILKNHSFMVETIYEFLKLQGRVLIRIVGADSLKGFFLSLRYRLGTGPAIIVEGRVFKGNNLKCIREALKYAEDKVLEVENKQEF